MGVVVYLGMNALMIFFFLKTPTAAVLAAVGRAALHSGAFCQFPFRWIYYCHSSKSTGVETGKMHLCAMYDFVGLFECVVVFPQAPFRVRMFPTMPLPVSSNCATAPWPPVEGAVGDFVTPFVLK